MSDASNPQAIAERSFLHDIATPTAVALGMVDLILDDASEGSVALEDGVKKRLEKAQAALLKLQEMMSARRAVLIAASEKK